MVNTQPAVDPKGRYSPTQTAKLLGISIRSVYNWEEYGRLTRTFCANYSYFTGADIIRAWKGIY